MIASLSYLAPEGLLLVLSSALLLWGVGLSRDRFAQLHYSALLIGVLALLLWQFTPLTQTPIFNNHFVLDPLAHFMKGLLLVISVLIQVYNLPNLQARGRLSVEYFFLHLMSLLGMLTLVSSASLLSLYLGLELLSLPLYALCAYYHTESKGSEAAVKYFMTGALASGLFLFGCSLIYLSCGSLFLAEIKSSLQAVTVDKLPIAATGIIFLLSGVFFKLGAVPFHMWLPDVYEGAPSSVVMTLGILPKIAACGMLLRLLMDMPIAWHGLTYTYITVVALLSLIWGNVAALLQANIKRMLSYSAIGHIGFVLLAVVLVPSQGLDAVLFYLSIYALMITATFALLLLLARQGLDIHNLNDLKGLVHYAPYHAFGFLITMFAMSGIPPTAGFFAKFLVIKGLVSEGQTALGVVALLCSVIAAFYYLNVVRVIFFEEAPTIAEQLPMANVDVFSRSVLTINHMALIILGIAPGWFYAQCQVLLNS